MTKPLIISPNGYAVEIAVLLDPSTGATEVQVRNLKPNTPMTVDMFKIATLLVRHGSELLESLMQGKLKTTPLMNELQEKQTNA